jgi:hypothetical protein
MEEIVASIRRIIAQGGGPAGTVAPTSGEPSSTPEGSDPAAATTDDASGAPAGDFAAPVEPAPPVSDQSPQPFVELSAETEPTMIDASDHTETQPFPASPDQTDSYAAGGSSESEGASTDAGSSGSDTVSAAKLETGSAGSEDAPLISGDTAHSTRAAFGQLTETFTGARDGRTVEQIVENLLRPQLKAWLDENLASIVHARVQAEVERIARTRGR